MWSQVQSMDDAMIRATGEDNVRVMWSEDFEFSEDRKPNIDFLTDVYEFLVGGSVQQRKRRQVAESAAKNLEESTAAASTDWRPMHSSPKKTKSWLRSGSWHRSIQACSVS